MAAEVFQQFKADFFFIQGIAAHGTAGCQIVAAFRHDDFRPQHPWRVVKPEIIGQKQALFGFSNAWFIACFGGLFAQHAVD